jgi:hypothetical protein
MMHKQMPYGGDRKTQESDRVDRILGRKDGGRVKADEGTNIHIEINADPKAAQSAEDMPPMAGPVPPPPPPMMPPPGIGGPPPGGGGMGPITGLKTGGKVGSASSYKDMDAGAASGPGREEKTDIAAKQRRGKNK